MVDRLPANNRHGRAAMAMFALYVRDCGRLDAPPDRATLEREWLGQSQFLRDGWLEDAAYVLRAIGTTRAEEPRTDA